MAKLDIDLDKTIEGLRAKGLTDEDIDRVLSIAKLKRRPQPKEEPASMLMLYECVVCGLTAEERVYGIARYNRGGRTFKLLSNTATEGVEYKDCGSTKVTTTCSLCKRRSAIIEKLRSCDAETIGKIEELLDGIH